MTRKILTSFILSTAAISFAACSQNAADTDTAVVTKPVTEQVMDAASTPKPGADISEISSGTYAIDPAHGYVTFSYLHGKYSRPILRWGEVDATIELDSENPETSSLTVSIPTASIDSGVAEWDEHLVSSDWFDAANHPTITFSSTDLNAAMQGRGTLTGDLTIKGNTRPITLDVTLNGVGQHFRSKKDMFGISATGSLKRGDFGVDTYLPNAADVTLQIEAEFIKADE